MPPVNQITQNAYEKHAWIIFLAVGILILIVGLNFLTLPYYEPTQWDYLTSDPKVVNHINMGSKALGLVGIGFAILTIAVSLTSYRRGEKWSWYTLCYFPVFWGLMALLWT